MGKKLIFIFLTVIIMAGCSQRENKPAGTQNNENPPVLKHAVSGSIAFDGDRIFYINNENKLYSMKKDGSEKTPIFDKSTIYIFQIYGDKIYMLHVNYKEEIPCRLYSVNKDGTGFEEQDMGLEFSSKYYVSDFVISRGLLFFIVNDFTETADIDFPKQYYIYDLNSGSLTHLYKDFVSSYGKPVIYDNIFYCLEYGTSEYDVLHKYNMDTEEKSTVNINKNSHRENFITSELHMRDDSIYYSGKTYIDIDKDSTGGSAETVTLFEDDDYMVVTMTMTDEYIFFINLNDLRKEDINSEIMNLDIYRIKTDGSEIKKIFTETTDNTNLPPNVLSIEADDVLVYKNRLTDTIVIMDLNGNVLDEIAGK